MRFPWVFLGFALALAACDEVYSGAPNGAPSVDPGSEKTEADASVEWLPTLNDPVIEHHNSPTRDGLYIVHNLTREAAAHLTRVPDFKATYDGKVDGQPLYVPDGPGGAGAYYVVTESNDVIAIEEKTGRTLWTVNLGVPATRVNKACPGLNPFGVTGTPYIDLATRTIFVDAIAGDGEADDDVRYVAGHWVHALSLDDGKERKGWPVNPDGTESGGYAVESRLLTQRGAMALVDGTLYVPYGAANDCDQYHGTVLAIDVAKPSSITAWIAQCARGGGIWSSGGVMSDGNGKDVFIPVANGVDSAPPWTASEALMRFPVGPFPKDSVPADFFAPSDWLDLDQRDADIDSALLIRQPGRTPSVLAIELGKDGFVLGLDAHDLGNKVGAEPLFRVQVGKNLKGAAAAVFNDDGAMLVIDAKGTSGRGLGCPEGQSGDLIGVQIVSGSPPTAHTAWCASSGGHGAPIITTTDGKSEAIVWVTGASTPTGRLRGFDAMSGEVVFDGGEVRDTTMVMSGLHHLSTLIAANGRLVVAADDELHAFTF